jgi:arginine decarboxylase
VAEAGLSQLTILKAGIMGKNWSYKDSRELYNVLGWGGGLFDVSSEGHMVMSAEGRCLDIPKLVDDLVARDIEPPILIRFMDVLHARVHQLCDTFRSSIEQLNYEGQYRAVFPVKVNQQRHVVEEIVKCGRPYHLGLECGSKPELMIVLAEVDDPDAVIVCNGYKDREYIEMALIARKLGRRCFLVLEQRAELDMVMKVADALDIEPEIGVRTRLHSTGTGRWKESSGLRAKFGLSAAELVWVVERLRERKSLHWLRMLHFHIGSQVSSIRRIQAAVREGARFYTEVVQMGAPLGFLDVGGGLGIDYDGSRTDSESSINYDLGEYADTIVSTVQQVCDSFEVPHPTLVTETGRAMVAHASMLVVPVLGTSEAMTLPPSQKSSEFETVRELRDIVDNFEPSHAHRDFHRALSLREDMLRRFELGMACLEERASVETLYNTLASTMHSQLGKSTELPEDLEDLELSGIDVFYCNFSVFQSMPDSWAIKQVFPIVPLQRLCEHPERRGTLADLTCDSDGRVDRFVDVRDIKRALELHAQDGRPYYLGVFLLGAYQEILGDLHNLFGDTHAVHVKWADNAVGYRIEQIIEGETAADVLDYVQYDHRKLLARVRDTVERHYEAGDLTLPQGRILLKAYRQGLSDYTYLDQSEYGIKVETASPKVETAS